MTRFWQRRLAVICLVAGLLTGLLYVAALVGPRKLGLPAVGMYSAIAGVLAIAVGIYSLVHTHTEDIAENARLTYLVLALLLGVLIYSTGTLNSPFTLFWGVIALTAPLFGGWGIIPVLAASVALPFLQNFTGHISFDTAWKAACIAVVPLLFGFLIKPKANAQQETDEDKSYHALARELSQVTGKSDVVINAIGEGVLSVDGNGVIQLINPAAQTIIGWGKEDAVGLNYKSVLKLVNDQGNEIDSAHDPVAKTFSSNTSTTDNTLNLMTQSGKKLLVSIVVSPTGQPGAGAIIVFRDITNEKAEERQQAEFISTASHEMRTPVATIEGYLGLVLNPQTAQIDEKARDFITKAHEAAQHLGRLFQDLLDVSKAEDGRMQNNPKVVDMTKFMHDVVEGLRPKADAKGLILTYKPTVGTGDSHEKGIGRIIAPAFYTNVDNDHLREVADNLVENAIKYTPQGHVTVDVTGDDQHVTISIADTGLGIPREDLTHLFQKFYRVDNSQTREIGGTGLGLYLCRRLVEAMNGRIWVDSTFQQGSTFYVELPRTSSVEAAQMIQKVEAAVEQDTTTAMPQPAPIPQPAPSTLPSDDLLATIVSPTPVPAPALVLQPQPVPTPAPMPVVPPEVAAQPLAPPVTPPPMTQPQPAPVSPMMPHPIEQFPNTSLAAIEQNPAQYIAQTEGRSSLAIPQRKP